MLALEIGERAEGMGSRDYWRVLGVILSPGVFDRDQWRVLLLGDVCGMYLPARRILDILAKLVMISSVSS